MCLNLFSWVQTPWLLQPVIKLAAPWGACLYPQTEPGPPGPPAPRSTPAPRWEWTGRTGEALCPPQPPPGALAGPDLLLRAEGNRSPGKERVWPWGLLAGSWGQHPGCFCHSSGSPSTSSPVHWVPLSETLAGEAAGVWAGPEGRAGAILRGLLPGPYRWNRPTVEVVSFPSLEACKKTRMAVLHLLTGLQRALDEGETTSLPAL